LAFQTVVLMVIETDTHLLKDNIASKFL